MSAPAEVLPDLIPRLEAAARDVADLKDALRNAYELRNRLVVEAVDRGVSQRAVARAAGVSQPYVVQLLANSQT